MELHGVTVNIKPISTFVAIIISTLPTIKQRERPTTSDDLRFNTTLFHVKFYMLRQFVLLKRAA
jgi:hypothetical protein